MLHEFWASGSKEDQLDEHYSTDFFDWQLGFIYIDIRSLANNADGVSHKLTQTYSLLIFVCLVLRLRICHKSIQKAQSGPLSSLDNLVLFLFLKIKNDPDLNV